MARTPVLGGGGLSPFGGGGVNFSAFDVVDPGREAYLAFLKVKVDWEQGKIPNASYLTAYQTYVNAQTVGTSNRIEGEQSLRDARYRLERNDKLAAVERGQMTWTQLAAYDKSKLTGLDHKSQEYLDRKNLYEQTQSRGLSDAAQKQHDLYDAGKITSTQLRSWYKQRALDPAYGDNPDLLKSIKDQIKSLDLRVTGELDNHMIQQFNDGKVGSSAFLVYAAAAKARYAGGTEKAREWADLIDNAKQQVAEKGLTYRYGLSQQYITLQKFIKDNRDMLARAGTGSTSTSSRIVLGADGHWKEVQSTKSTPYKPSASEIKAMSERRIELADAQRQMAELTRKIGGNGGFVTTDSMISFYTGRQGKVVKGSPEWYTLQERLDGLQQQKHQESVLRQEGVHVTYGGGGGHVASSGGSGGGTVSGGTQAGVMQAGGGGGSTSSKNISVDAFMRSVAVTESGGNYGAVNKSSGAYGKYQIMPANWPSWAGKYLGDASAPTTPENQEKVARGKMLDLYKWLGSWDKVAHWWLTGNPNPAPGTWSQSSKNYVNGIMARLGSGPVQGTAGPARMPTIGSSRVAAAAPTGAVRQVGGIGPNTANPQGPLEVVTGQTTTVRRGPQHLITTRVNFPTNLDGSAFTKFYSGFSQAFSDGATTFTDWSSGKAVTYSIPTDLAERIGMMNTVDDLRIGYYAKRAQVYEGTPSEFTAAHEYSEAVKDKADHAYTILITNQPKGAVVGLKAGLAFDPIAQGIAVKDKAEKFVADQIAAAKRAYAAGDVTGAYSHVQLAQRSIAETDEKIKLYTHAADATMQAIHRASGEAAPDKVAKDFADLKSWQSSTGLAKSFKDADELMGDLVGSPDSPGWLEVDASGNPRWTDGQVKLRAGAAIFLTEDGKVKYDQVPSAGYAKPGSNEQVPAIPGFVAITMNQNGSVVGDQHGGITAYAKWHEGTVGFTASGAPIKGKVVSGSINGKPYIFNEDPFHPGKWSAANATFAVPAGFSVVPGAQAGTSAYQFSKDGATFRLDWDPETGAYNVIKAGSIFNGGVDQVLPIGDADTQALLDGAGFKIDMSGVALGDRWQYGMDGAHPGFDKDSYEAFTHPAASVRPVPIDRKGTRNIDLAEPERPVQRLDLSPDARQERTDAARLPQPKFNERDNWQQDQLSRIAAAPGYDNSPDARQERADALRSIPRSNPVTTPLRKVGAVNLDRIDDKGVVIKRQSAPKTVAPASKVPPPAKRPPTSRNVDRREPPTPVKKIAPLPTLHPSDFGRGR